MGKRGGSRGAAGGGGSSAGRPGQLADTAAEFGAAVDAELALVTDQETRETLAYIKETAEAEYPASLSTANADGVANVQYSLGVQMAISHQDGYREGNPQLAKSMERLMIGQGFQPIRSVSGYDGRYMRPASPSTVLLPGAKVRVVHPGWKNQSGQHIGNSIVEPA